MLLADFFAASSEDGRMGPTHVSLYMALLHLWTEGGSRNPIVITRERVMKAARVRARGTYHRCMRELHGYGYIRYLPSSHPSSGSTVYLQPL